MKEIHKGIFKIQNPEVARLKEMYCLKAVVIVQLGLYAYNPPECEIWFQKQVLLQNRSRKEKLRTHCLY
jgi:hypothetical protein